MAVRLLRNMPQRFCVEREVGEYVRYELPPNQSMAGDGIRLGLGQYYADFEHLGVRNWINQGSCGVLSYCRDDQKS